MFQNLKFSQNKNGIKLVENISCDILSRCPRYQRSLLFFCMGTQLLRDKRRESPKSFICSALIGVFFQTIVALVLSMCHVYTISGSLMCPYWFFNQTEWPLKASLSGYFWSKLRENRRMKCTANIWKLKDDKMAMIIFI